MRYALGRSEGPTVEVTRFPSGLEVRVRQEPSAPGEIHIEVSRRVALTRISYLSEQDMTMISLVPDEGPPQVAPRH